MKRFLIILLLVTIGTFHIHAQTEKVEYGYDLSGNRVLRHIIPLSMHESVQPDSLAEDPDNAKLFDFAEMIDDCRITIFPNPTNGILKVVLDSKNEHPEANLFLHTVAGTKVLSRSNIREETELDISDRENGAYILTVVIKGRNKSWKILKY
jgi:type IX secretion system substrate protein